MEFTNTPMEWNNAGTEPPESLKNNGWEANQKPPANYFNKKWHNDYKVQKELQEAINTLDETVSKTSEEFMLNKDNWSARSGENSTYCQVVTLSNYEPTDKVLVSIKHNIVKSQLKDISEKNFRVNALSSAGALTLYIDDLPTTHIYIVVSYLGKCTGGSLVTTFPYTPYPTKELIGLGNVDNTSDENKPVSTFVQEALDGRLPFGICTTSGGNPSKTVIIPNYTVTGGSWFCLVFTESNAASSAYLTVNGFGSYDIYFGDTGQFADITANTLYLVYLDDIDGTYYFTDLSVETSASPGSTSLITSGGVYNALGGKAAVNHTHSANDIDSGTLPITKGGTGAATAAAARANLGLAAVAASGEYDDLNNKPFIVVGTTEELLNAINSLDTSEGGIIFMLPGTYDTTAAISLNKHNITLIGSGNGTIISTTKSFAPISILGNNCTLKNFKIFKNTSSVVAEVTGGLISITAAAGLSNPANLLIDNIYMDCNNTSLGGAFVTLSTKPSYLRITNCIITTDEDACLISDVSGYYGGLESGFVSNTWANANLSVPENVFLSGNINITAG